jgi:hypothetical protein
VLLAPQQTVTLLRGQCRDGDVTENADGAVVASWNHPISAQVAEFDCEPGDFDADGCVWLLLKVDAGGGDSSQIMSPWHLDRLELGYRARVVAAPGIGRRRTGGAQGAAHGNP